jgi:hypothetical protein
MGTKSLVHVKDDKKTLVTLYRQYDGYPSGMGADIKRILNEGDVKVLNGFSRSQKSPEFFNGAGCLSAYLVGQLKKNSIGDVYLYPPNSEGLGEEFVYTVTVTKKNTVNLRILDVYKNKILFNGQLKDFSVD